MHPNSARALCRLMRRLQLQGILVTGLPNVRYLSGFTGSDATLWISRTSRVLFTDSRYLTQAREESPDFQVVEYRRKVEEISRRIKQRGVKRLGFEPSRMSLALYREYRRHLRGIRFVALSKELEWLRVSKRAEELRRIGRAGRIAWRAFQEVLPLLRPGVAERAVALELEHRMKHLGAEEASFATIVASGRRGALPHGAASTKKLRAGELVTLDFGCRFQGYHSDQTITVGLGEPAAKQKQIYEIVRQAQARAIAEIRPGAALRGVDAVARDYIREQGYGDYFGHGLGHGVGLEVHEEPYLNPRSQGRLEPGMVLTVEPGIYLPGWGGVRIEEMVVVTPTGHRVLTRSSGPLRILPV